MVAGEERPIPLEVDPVIPPTCRNHVLAGWDNGSRITSNVVELQALLGVAGEIKFKKGRDV